MPPREAKGRVLTREYMADAEFWRSHQAETRELMMLLALFTDDGGWMEWDPDYLRSTIYRYSEYGRGRFDDLAKELVVAGRLRILKCGHAFMPRVAKRPRGMTREYSCMTAHEQHSKSSRKELSNSSTRAVDHLSSPFNNRSKPDQSSSYPSEPTRERSPAKGGARLADLIGPLADGIVKPKGGASS